ncbi:MAG: universal stress protein [Candidatus Bipolaricaulota bacterium]
MKVLFATDFSAASRKAGECLGELEGLDQVVLLHVVEDEGEGAGQDRLSAEQRREFAAMGNTLQEGTAEVTTEVTTAEGGAAHEAIVRVAQEHEVDLIVLGSRGGGFLRRAFVGSVAADVARTSPLPVLIERVGSTDEGEVQRICQRPFAHLLAATDFSSSAEKMLGFLAGLQGLGRATLVHVLELPVDDVIALEHEHYQQATSQAEQELARQAEALRAKHGIEVDVHVRAGIASAEIARVAQEVGATCVAVGSRGQSRIAELLWGSTAEDLVRRGCCRCWWSPPGADKQEGD